MTGDADDPIACARTPCVRNCCLDGDDICMGCYRSLSEILCWAQASENEKGEIWDRCHLRGKQRKTRS
jgi:predicted Fe-S protein YdhL (DUF1289 family)